MLRAVVSSPINALLVVAPVSWVLAITARDSPCLFLTAAAALIPLAGLIGLGTEQLAARSGTALGGFLNATFGNAAELIIAVVALVMPAVFDLTLKQLGRGAAIAGRLSHPRACVLFHT